MVVIKKYRAFMLGKTTINDDTSAVFRMERNGYRHQSYSESFDTEQEAIEFCFKTDKYERWVIVPEITFH